MTERRRAFRRFVMSVPPLVIAALLMLLTFLVATAAWLSLEKGRPHVLSATGTTVWVDGYFMNDGVKVAGSNYQENGCYLLDISNPAAPNYVKKFRADIYASGTTRSYLRVYVADMVIYPQENDEGTLVDTSILREALIYALPANTWYDNRNFDSRYYYVADGLPGRGILTPSTSEVKFPLITGIASDIASVAGGKIYVDIRAETVQFNRIEAFWGMVTLPV